MRPDALFSRNKSGVPRAPFLHEIVSTKGTFGVSHAQAPTETRPCHSEILGGVHEDLTALYKKWEALPVPHDSVVNQTDHAWAFGAPDVVPLFANVANQHKQHVEAFNYSQEQEIVAVDSFEGIYCC